MKIIDLLNKIANGNIPKRIIYDEYVYVWNNKIENYEREINIDVTLNWDYIAINCLNEPVIIIGEEEKKTPEKIPLSSYHNSTDDIKEKVLINKINEIIDYLDYLKLYFIENPRGGLRKMDFMKNLPRYTVT